MGKVHQTMEELFPASIRIDGKVYPAAYVGGRGEQEAEDGGFVDRIDCAFRVSKSVLSKAPRIGSVLYYQQEDGEWLELSVRITPPRPHETEHYIGCVDADA